MEDLPEREGGEKSRYRRLQVCLEMDRLLAVLSVARGESWWTTGKTMEAEGRIEEG